MEGDEKENLERDDEVIAGQIAYDEMLAEMNANKVTQEETPKNVILNGQMDFSSIEQVVKQRRIEAKTSMQEEFEQLEASLEKHLPKQNQNLREKKVKKQIKQEKMDLTEDQTIYKSLDEVLHESMIPYTEHVVMDRALPRVEDGH